MRNANRKKTTNQVMKRAGAARSKAKKDLAVPTDGAKSGSGTENSPEARPSRVRATAGHFAERSYAWGVGKLGREGGYIQGSVAISRPDVGPTSIYGAIFDHKFQREMAQLQERGALRRAGHSFHTHTEWTLSSYLVHGEITHHGSSTSFIGVEAHTYGAVTVYFRENTKATTIDELVAWWIFGAWWMGLAVHALMGTSGPVHAAVLVDLANVSDVSIPDGRSHVESMHGPFLLEPPENEDRAYNSALSAALTQIATVRADLLRQSTGRPWLRDAAEETNWTPDAARHRIAAGRPADLGTEAGGGKRRAGRLGGRIFKRG